MGQSRARAACALRALLRRTVGHGAAPRERERPRVAARRRAHRRIEAVSAEQQAKLIRAVRPRGELPHARRAGRHAGHDDRGRPVGLPHLHGGLRPARRDQAPRVPPGAGARPHLPRVSAAEPGARRARASRGRVGVGARVRRVLCLPRVGRWSTATGRGRRDAARLARSSRWSRSSSFDHAADPALRRLRGQAVVDRLAAGARGRRQSRSTSSCSSTTSSSRRVGSPDRAGLHDGRARDHHRDGGARGARWGRCCRRSAWRACSTRCSAATCRACSRIAATASCAWSTISTSAPKASTASRSASSRLTSSTSCCSACSRR